jgi:hypothetical protein
MKTEEVTKKTMEFIGNNSKSTPQAIATSIRIPVIQIYGVLNKLVSNKKIKEERLNDAKAYSIISGSSIRAEKHKVSENDEVRLAGSRDTSKYKLQDKVYSKSRLCQALVIATVKDKKKITFQQLTTLYPDTIAPSYGFLRELSKAKKASAGGRERFFLSEIINVSDGKKNLKLVVSNQITAEKFKQVLAIARSLNYNITKVS